jgi:hypothetical protein
MTPISTVTPNINANHLLIQQALAGNPGPCAKNITNLYMSK